MMKFHHFFWDFDGTLFHTYPRVCRAMMKALHDVGIDAQEDELMAKSKVSLEAASEYYGAPKGIAVDTIMARYRVHSEEEGYDTMPAYDGCVDFLRGVIARGGKNYLYTHRGESAYKALDHYGMTHLFADFVTSLDGFPQKPCPDALNALCTRNHLDKRDCIMLGDRAIDLQAGINAGMSCALMDPDGYCPAFEQAAAEAHSYRELSEKLL